MSEVVRLEVADGIGTIVLDRPKMNALDAEMQRQLVAVAEEAAERTDVKAVIVWGGERVFAAGADVKEMAEMSYTDMAAHVRLLQRFSRALASIPKPTVAAITGFALGGGLETALCCDFRVVADNAKLGLPEITLGIIPGAGGTQRLTRLVGPAVAAGAVLSWARAMGEFGATITFAGNAPGVTQTAPLAIYVSAIDDPQAAIPLSLILVVVSLIVVVGVHSRRSRVGGGL